MINFDPVLFKLHGLLLFLQFLFRLASHKGRKPLHESRQLKTATFTPYLPSSRFYPVIKWEKRSLRPGVDRDSLILEQQMIEALDLGNVLRSGSLFRDSLKENLRWRAQAILVPRDNVLGNPLTQVCWGLKLPLEFNQPSLNDDILSGDIWASLVVWNFNRLNSWCQKQKECHPELVVLIKPLIRTIRLLFEKGLKRLLQDRYYFTPEIKTITDLLINVENYTRQNCSKDSEDDFDHADGLSEAMDVSPTSDLRSFKKKDSKATVTPAPVKTLREKRDADQGDPNKQKAPPTPSEGDAEKSKRDLAQRAAGIKALALQNKNKEISKNDVCDYAIAKGWPGKVEKRKRFNIDKFIQGYPDTNVFVKKDLPGVREVFYVASDELFKAIDKRIDHPPDRGRPTKKPVK